MESIFCCYVWIGGASLQLIEGVFEALQTQFMSLSSEIAKEHFLMNLKDNSFENLNSEFVKGMEFLDPFISEEPRRFKSPKWPNNPNNMQVD